MGAGIIILLLFFATSSSGQSMDQMSNKRFKSLSAKRNWKIVFKDPMKKNWEQNWFLDGVKGKIHQHKSGLDFWAGHVAGQDPYHAVLWTNTEFSGDIRIEYEYTRLDTATRYVNIIYFLATGSGQDQFDSDISKWNEFRKIPAMRTYFNNMHTYHISYAAFGNKDNRPDEDYIRLRRYMPDPGTLAGTEISPSYEKTGFFKTGIPHKITLIKKGEEYFFYVQNAEKSNLYYWKNDKFPSINSGRIGLRHMYTRGARYSNFKVYIFKE